MFTIYYSNQLDLFKELLINIMLDAPLSDPMQSEIILIENNNCGIIKQWIQIELANCLGIAANIEFMDVASFIRKTYSKTLFNYSIKNKFTYMFMYWVFMEILSKPDDMQKNCSIILQYLHNDKNQRKCGQLADQLVHLFTQYLIYRPDWLEIWRCHGIVDSLKNNNHQVWQAELWRIFLKRIKYNSSKNIFFFNPFQFCMHVLKNVHKIYHNLPNRIFVVGITSLAPIYWKMLKILSHHVNIYLWCINSCIHINKLSNYKEKIFFKVPDTYQFNNNNQLSINLFNFNYSIQKINNHPLLRSWGMVGCDTVCTLFQLKNITAIKKYFIPNADSLLHILQKDILEYKYTDIISVRNKQRYILKLTDKSITFHICHSIQREIEILHDNLLSMFVDNPLLSPGDIVVMAPDIHDYAAAIQTVFNNIHGRDIPFVIASNHIKNMHPVILTFFKILDIPNSRFTSEEILSLLMMPTIATRFNINTKEMNLLRQWTIESGIRWGLDNITVRNLNLPVIDQNTWNFGWIRMLLGYAMRSRNGVWKGIAPYENILIEEYIEIISRLGIFLKTLRKWRDRLNQNYILSEWIINIREIIGDFFYSADLSTDENKAIFLLKNGCNNIIEAGIRSGYTQHVNIVVLRDKLYQKFSREKIEYTFSPNAINFCDITSTCYISFKVVCLLGMNNNKFPRDGISPNFNLMLQKPRNGDNNVYEKDCYSFLMTFLLAKERIYISFIGCSMYDGTKYYPSTLINELIEYIAQTFYLIEDKDLNINANIQRIRHHLFRWYNQVSFSSENFIPNSNYQSFAKEWLSSASIKANNLKTNFFVPSHFITFFPKNKIEIVLLRDLYNFYCHPIRAWFQKYLGVYFEKNLSQLINNEPFSIERSYRFHLNMKIIHCLLHNKNIEELYHIVRSSGILPYGAFGKLCWIEQYELMVKLNNRIKKHYLSEQCNLNVSLSFDKMKLVGRLHAVQKNGLIRWKPTYLSIKDGLLLWLEHLIYCSIGGNGDSRLFGINNIWHFPNLSISHAQKLLFFYVSGYCIGINTPLLLLPKSGGIWINCVFDRTTNSISLKKSDQKKARQKLIRTWQGEPITNKRAFNVGEYYDPYFRAVMPFHLDQKDINKITKTAKFYFFDVLKYREL